MFFALGTMLACASHFPSEFVEKAWHWPNLQLLPEPMQLRIAFSSSPDNEDYIRFCYCLANGSTNEFVRGEGLCKCNAVKNPGPRQSGQSGIVISFELNPARFFTFLAEMILNDYILNLHKTPHIEYTGFQLSGSVFSLQRVIHGEGSVYQVAVTFDRRRITSCKCTCDSRNIWCGHIIAACLYRMHQVPDQFITLMQRRLGYFPFVSKHL